MSDAQSNSPLDDPNIGKQTVTNDAVAGETVIDNGHYAGPEGSEPLEATPEYDGNDLDASEIDLDETDETPDTEGAADSE